jgi:ADP-ribose pyrophosphatase YjhB (NUDIX family)
MADGKREQPRFDLQVPDGDNRERLVCRECGWIHYENPKVVVGAVVHHDERLLLCRRAIEPRRGYWTMPAGFLEERETPEEGARRETMEEAGAVLDIEALLAVYSLRRISQIQLIYKARLARPEFYAGEESLEVRLFEWERIPWEELAFPTVHWALHHFREVRGVDTFAPFGNPA